LDVERENKQAYLNSCYGRRSVTYFTALSYFVSFNPSRNTGLACGADQSIVVNSAIRCHKSLLRLDQKKSATLDATALRNNLLLGRVEDFKVYFSVPLQAISAFGEVDRR
jgi:hypothetical protein